MNRGRCRAWFGSQQSPVDSYTKYCLTVRGKRQRTAHIFRATCLAAPEPACCCVHLRSLWNCFAPDLNETGWLSSNILISFLPLPQPITSCRIPVFTPNLKNGEWNIATKGEREGSKDEGGGGVGGQDFKKEKGEKIFAVPISLQAA